MFPREYRGVLFVVVLFLAVQIGALALVQTFFEQGYQAVENPDDPTNSVVYIGAILVATVFMLAAFKYDLDWIVRLVVVFTSGLLAFYVFTAVLPWWASVAGGAIIALGLLIHPEWYVIDAAGVLMGAGAAGLFGITFGILPALLLLVVLAIYDAISVYGTEHMLDLASGVMDLRIPVVLVVPLSLSYSTLDDDGESRPDGIGDDPAEADESDDADLSDEGSNEADTSNDNPSDDQPDDTREAFFIGLGDAVIPTVLIASAAFFSPANSYRVPVIELNTPALAAAVGTIGGLLVLMWMVMKGRPHAGLPLLNGGAIGGYLVGSIVAGVSMLEAIGIAPLV
ncbi:MAG: presenilin family intramembrane aspartyl protease PSH [Halobacteriota archaeon]